MMKRKLFILALLTVLAVSAFLFQEWNRRSAFQKSATVPVSMQGMTIMPDGTRIDLHTDEKLDQLPVVVLKRQPATEDKTQTFEVSVYRHGTKTPDNAETLPCEKGRIDLPFAERRNGSDFHFVIPHAKVEGDSYHFILNGKDLGGFATQAPAKPASTDDQTTASQPTGGDDQP